MRVVALLSAMVAGASAFGTFEMIQMLRIKWMEVDDMIYRGCTEVSPGAIASHRDDSLPAVVCPSVRRTYNTT
jgi:hypothetical protein